VTEFKREVRFTPAYDLRSDDPQQNYGIGGVVIWFFLIGDKGAVQYKLGTNWYLPQVQREQKPRSLMSIEPRGWDIGYHSPDPMYEGQEQLTESCPLLGDKPCYYDGSSLRADEFVPMFLAGGSDAVWEMLEEYYYDIFG
jgi:hypothetical protein